MDSIPLLDLKAQFQSIQPEVERALLEVVRDQRFILGPEVEALESEIAAYVGAQHAVGVSSGSDALLVALLALGVGPGDEVITSPFSFFASAGSIARCGARPVFADIDAESFNLDPEEIARRISPRTRAIMPVHLFGRCAAMEEIAAVAGDIPMVEDAAQAIGAARSGTSAGTLGQIGCFSFFPSKNLGGYGDGGMVTTNDPGLASRLRALRVHGQLGIRRYQHDLVGGNYRLDALQAAILRVKLAHLDDWTDARRATAGRYRELLDDTSVKLPPPDPPGGRDVYNQFVIRVDGRDRLREDLMAGGIGCAIYYPRGLHDQPCFSDLGYGHGDFPVCEEATRQCLALPIYPELKDAQLRRVADVIRRSIG